ncbi:MAG: protein ImuA [Pseudomonadota bacterium]|nr:protein ImuA [Pseudomonadota bacterium]
MKPLSPPPASYLDAVRAEVRAIETSVRSGECGSLPFGIAAMDQRLAGGGLATAALHEATGSSPSLNDDAAATLFAAGIASRASGTSDKILWVVTRHDLFAPALAQAGLAPRRLIYAECRRDDEALAVMEEGLRGGGLAAVVGEIGRATMTATRRLQLAAEDNATMALMVRRWRRSGEDPFVMPSAAATRWRIGCLSSQELPTNGIARPRWHMELARQRGGQPHQWIMEGTDEAGRLALPAEPAHRPASADRRAFGRAA